MPFEEAVFIASKMADGTFLYSYTAPDTNTMRSVEDAVSYIIFAITEEGILYFLKIACRSLFGIGMGNLVAHPISTEYL